MSVKNPYKLLEKANSTFNLYLEKYSEIEKYMEESKKNQKETGEKIDSFLEKDKEMRNQLDAANLEILELIQKQNQIIQEHNDKIDMIGELNDEIQKQKELTSNIENKLAELDQISEDNKQEIVNSIEKIQNDINAHISSNHQEINKSFSYLDSSINSRINGSYDEFKSEINDSKDELNKSIERTVEGQNKLNETVNKQNKFIENQNIIYKKINNKVQNFDNKQNRLQKTVNTQNNQIKTKIDNVQKKQDKLQETVNKQNYKTNKHIENQNTFNKKIKTNVDNVHTKQDKLQENVNKQNNQIKTKIDNVQKKQDKLQETVNKQNYKTNTHIEKQTKANTKIQNIENKQERLQETINKQNFKTNAHIEKQSKINTKLQNIENKQDRLQDTINKQNYKTNAHIEEQTKEMNKIKNFIQSQNDINSDLRLAVKLFNENYAECKRFFFNDMEDMLKEHFNTDDLFRMCYFNNMEFLSYSPLENRIIIKTKDNIKLSTNNRFYTIKEVIGFNGYSIPQLFEFDNFSVIDIGMNRAYASLWFANFENCTNVYGFEIDEDTYNKAVYNINLNPELSKKIKYYNYGLSDKNEFVDLYCLDGCDGVNTMKSELTEIQPELKSHKSKINVKPSEVKKASEVVSEILKETKKKNKIVLKIDTEGAEYQIVNDLVESELIEKVDVILGEEHLISDTMIVDILSELGFTLIKIEEYDYTCTFAFVKSEYCDKWPLKID